MGYNLLLFILMCKFSPVWSLGVPFLVVVKYFIVFAISYPNFSPLAPFTQPVPLHSQSPHRCPCPQIKYICSLANSFTFYQSVPTYIPPSYSCQSTPCFCVSGSILLISLFFHQFPLVSEIIFSCFCLALQSPVSSMLSQKVRIPSFLLVCTVPLCKCPIFVLSTHLLMDTWAASISWQWYTKYAAMKLGVLMFFQISIFSSFRYIPRSGMIRSKDRSIFNFLR